MLQITLSLYSINGEYAKCLKSITGSTTWGSREMGNKTGQSVVGIFRVNVIDFSETRCIIRDRHIAAIIYG